MEKKAIDLLIENLESLVSLTGPQLLMIGVLVSLCSWMFYRLGFAISKQRVTEAEGLAAIRKEALIDRTRLNEEIMSDLQKLQIERDEAISREKQLNEKRGAHDEQRWKSEIRSAVLRVAFISMSSLLQLWRNAELTRSAISVAFRFDRVELSLAAGAATVRLRRVVKKLSDASTVSGDELGLLVSSGSDLEDLPQNLRTPQTEIQDEIASIFDSIQRQIELSIESTPPNSAVTG